MRLAILPHPVRPMAAILIVLMACIVGRPTVHARPPDDARAAVRQVRHHPLVFGGVAEGTGEVAVSGLAVGEASRVCRQ